jgi:hypothetical protein
LSGGELEFAKAYLSGFELRLWLAELYGYTVTSPRQNVLRIDHDGYVTQLTLDSATRLPSRSASLSLADPDRPVSAEMHYVAWQEVSGVRFPTRRSNFQSHVNRGDVNTAEIHVNVGLREQDLAAKPIDFAPQLTRR